MKKAINTFSNCLQTGAQDTKLRIRMVSNPKKIGLVDDHVATSSGRVRSAKSVDFKFELDPPLK